MRANASGQSSLLLLDIIDILQKLEIPYAVIGAMAASFHGIVRASMDADAVISLQTGHKNLNEELKKTGLTVHIQKADFDDPVQGVIQINDLHHNKVDLLTGIRGMTKDVFSRNIKTTLHDAPMEIIGLEDFIAMKIYAGSPKDLADAKNALKVSKEKINHSLLQKLAQNYGKQERKTLDSLLKE